MGAQPTDCRDLRDRVTVKSKSTATDTQLGRSSAWTTTLATIWAAVRVTGASEPEENGRVTTVTSYEIEARYRADITTTMRAFWTPYHGSEKTLQITGIRPKPGRPERMLIDCQEAA